MSKVETEHLPAVGVWMGLKLRLSSRGKNQIRKARQSSSPSAGVRAARAWAWWIQRDASPDTSAPSHPARCSLPFVFPPHRFINGPPLPVWPRPTATFHLSSDLEASGARGVARPRFPTTISPRDTVLGVKGEGRKVRSYDGET